MTFSAGKGRHGGADDAQDVAPDIRRAVEAAVWAPSVHNTQPWTFDRVPADDEHARGLCGPVERRRTLDEVLAREPEE